MQDSPSDQSLRKAAARLAAARKQRSRVLPADLLGEPAWDILLELFSEIEPHDTRIVEDLIWKSIRFRSRHGENTFRNRRNGSLYNGNEAYHQETKTLPNIKLVM